MKGRIFILDDEKDMILMASTLLKNHGYVVSTETSPKKALLALEKDPPDLLLLDVLMPEMDGFEVVQKLKSNSKTASIPIVMVSMQSSEADVVAGLEMGAQDYICKPVRERELVARVKAVLRKNEIPTASQKITYGPLTIDKANYKVSLNGKPVELAPKEFQLLVFFLEREGQVLTRTVISEKVWEHAHIPQMRTIDTHVDNIRKKLGEYGRWIKGLRGIGYRFEIEI
jgi:DNA-binding response OmpR family regulator